VCCIMLMSLVPYSVAFVVDALDIVIRVLSISLTGFSELICCESQQRTWVISAYIVLIADFPGMFTLFCLQCFDAVGWATGRASSL